MAGLLLNTNQQEKELQKPVRGLDVVFGFLNKDIKLFGNQLKDKKKQNLYIDLQVLLSSGIDIKTSLEIICSETSKKEDKVLFEQVKADIIEGAGLSDALQKTNKFSAYEIFSIKIGEESGQLNEVIKNLCEYYSKKIEQKRKIVNAFS